MKKFIMRKFLIFIVFVITGCSSHHILIREDGTAHVEMNIFEQKTEVNNIQDSVNYNYSKEDYEDIELTVDKFYASEIISDFQYDAAEDEIAEKITFDIANVDSLGLYLDPLFGNYFEFRLSSDKLVISGSDGKHNPEDDITGMTNMLTVDATITFEKEIGEIITLNDYVKKTDKHTIEIKTSIGEMNYNGIGNRIEIVFK